MDSRILKPTNNLEKARMELLRRRLIRTRPIYVAERRFPYRYWKLQQEIIHAVLNNKHVTVKSCHSSGKTFLAASAVLLFMEAFVPSKCLTTAPSNTQVEKLLWAEINTQLRKANPSYPSKWRCLNKELKIDSDHFALGFSTDDEINFQGLHSANFLFVGDEAAGIPAGMFDAIKTLMTPQESHMLLIGNPDSLSGYFYRSHEMARFKKFTISAFDTPNFTEYGIDMDDIRTGDYKEKIAGKVLPYPALVSPDWVYDAYCDWGEESPLFVAKVFGEFPKSAIDALIPLDSINHAQRREGLQKGAGQWGLDVARFGSDSSVLTYRRGQRLEIVETFHHFDTVKLTEWGGRLIQQVDPKAPVVVDAVGIGAGVADMLRQHKKLDVFEYTGSAASNDDDCFNQRSEFYWHLRKLFTKGQIGGKIDEETKEELCAMDYEIRGGKVKVGEKAAIKKKINRSPDKADALMLCYAPIDSMSAVNDLIICSPPKPKEVANEDIEYWYPI